jgi:hypothetical protein
MMNDASFQVTSTRSSPGPWSEPSGSRSPFILGSALGARSGPAARPCAGFARARNSGATPRSGALRIVCLPSMKAFTVALVFLTPSLSAQSPGPSMTGSRRPREWSSRHPELAPRKAYEAALSQAVENLREARLERGRAPRRRRPRRGCRGLHRAHRPGLGIPAGLPGFAAGHRPRRNGARHGFGQSYQRRCYVRTDETRSRARRTRAAGGLDRSARKVKRALGMSVGSGS